MKQDTTIALATRFIERHDGAQGDDDMQHAKEIFDQVEDQLLRERFETLLDRNGFSDQDIGQIMENLDAGDRPSADYLDKKDSALASRLFMQAEGDIRRARNAAENPVPSADYDSEEPHM